jgi:hypothetical protein
MRKKQKENHIVRLAIMDMLTDCLWRGWSKNAMSDKPLKKRGIILDGYENEKDMVHFTNDGHKCILVGVSDVDMVEGLIHFILRTKLDGNLDDYEVILPVESFRLNTLKRIAYEIYDYVGFGEDKDFEECYKETVANWFDTQYDNL